MIKSFVPYRNEPVGMLTGNTAPATERLVTYYELYKLISHLSGAIIKCGVAADEAFSYFSYFKKVVDNRNQPMVSFEKNPSVFEVVEVNNENVTVVRAKHITSKQIELIKKAQMQNIEFLPGQLADSIPTYLMANPELKIALLTIDLEDYESTLTALQYLYPRLVSGGVLIINNYHKKNGESLAIKEYFNKNEVFVRHFSLEKGPHYILKD